MHASGSTAPQVLDQPWQIAAAFLHVPRDDAEEDGSLRNARRPWDRAATGECRDSEYHEGLTANTKHTKNLRGLRGYREATFAVPGYAGFRRQNRYPGTPVRMMISPGHVVAVWYVKSTTSSAAAHTM